MWASVGPINSMSNNDQIPALSTPRFVPRTKLMVRIRYQWENRWKQQDESPRWLQGDPGTEPGHRQPTKGSLKSQASLPGKDPARATRHSPGCLALCVYQGARTVESGVVFIVPQLSLSWRGTPGHSFSSAALGGGCAVGMTPSREEHDSLGSKTRDTGSME